MRENEWEILYKIVSVWWDSLKPFNPESFKKRYLQTIWVQLAKK